VYTVPGGHYGRLKAAALAATGDFLVGILDIVLLEGGTSSPSRVGESNTTPQCAGALGGVRNAFFPCLQKKKKNKIS